MSAIDTRLTLSRASDELVATCVQIEGISASMRVLAADRDGERVISDLAAARLLEMLAGVCDAVTHRLGIVHDMIEAAEGGEGQQDE